MTLSQITEEVKKAYVRSFDAKNPDQGIPDSEMRFYIEQATNELLSTEVNAKASVGNIDIPHCLIATYPGISVNELNQKSYVELPVYPVRLPMDIGVWSVVPEQGTILPYIPIPQSMWDLVESLDEGLLENQVGFYVEGYNIWFTRRLGTLTTPVTSVKLKLLVTDLSQIFTSDPWPIPAGMEMMLVERVITLLRSRPVRLTEYKSDAASN